MDCPKCAREMGRAWITIEGASRKAAAYECPCGYIEFEPHSAADILKELKAREVPLMIQQKIIKLSQDRLGFYFNKDIIRSLGLKSGATVHISVPDKKRIVLNL